MRRPHTAAVGRTAAVVRALAAGVSAAVLLTGCGVQETDVIEVGGPATVVAPEPGRRLLLFFLSREGHLTPVVRQLTSDAENEPVAAPKHIAALFAGPRADERAAGLHTGLPPLKGKMEVRVTPDEVRVVLPLTVSRLESTALRQLVCTAAYAEGGDGNAEVTVAGDDGSLPPASC